MIFIIHYIIGGLYMYFLATVHRKKSTQNFVVHATKVFSDESSSEVEIEKTFLVLYSNDNGTVEMSDVRLTLPLLLSVVVQTVPS